MRPRHLTAALPLVLALGVGCSDDGSDVASGTIEVHAVDYGYRELPERIAAGSTVSLVNDSEGELHELVAVRIPDDEDRSVERLLELPEDELEQLLFPQVTDVVVAFPGETDTPGAVMGDGVLEEPGRYAFACFIPVGADPEELMAAMESEEEPDADGDPHWTRGMFAEVEVVATDG